MNLSNIQRKACAAFAPWTIILKKTSSRFILHRLGLGNLVLKYSVLHQNLVKFYDIYTYKRFSRFLGAVFYLYLFIHHICLHYYIQKIVKNIVNGTKTRCNNTVHVDTSCYIRAKINS